MTTRELKTKISDLQNEAADLESSFFHAVVRYLSTIIEVVGCNADHTEGKACLEEINSHYDSDTDLVTIEYVIMNKYGDFIENKEIRVSSSEIDKYIV